VGSSEVPGELMDATSSTLRGEVAVCVRSSALGVALCSRLLDLEATLGSRVDLEATIDIPPSVIFRRLDFGAVHPEVEAERLLASVGPADGTVKSKATV